VRTIAVCMQCTGTWEGCGLQGCCWVYDCLWRGAILPTSLELWPHRRSEPL